LDTIIGDAVVDLTNRAEDVGAAGCRTIGELVELARQRLSDDVWDFVAGGAGTEATVRRNRDALDALLLAPRALSGVGAPRLTTSFAGLALETPVMLAPVGSIALLDQAGAAACARAAHRMGTAAWIGVLSSPSLEEVAAASPGPLALQLSVRGGRDQARELARRARDSGYRAICLTVDSATDGWRDRERCHPLPQRAALRSPNVDRATLAGAGSAAMTWDDVAWLREAIELPLVLKGISAVADAERAAQLGLAGVIVSNHGGRQLDHQAAAIDSLERIADAVGDRIELAVDGSIMRGTDVVKALALGARAVLVGRLMCWGLAADGEDGVVRALELVTGELTTTLIQLGVAGVDAVSRDQLQRTPEAG
jgi:isopentenyl diphosphate isomerase/L-lactate dehydrogenase-like FMN-dependent dehydrogenase